jgi:hypothetical protein
MVLGERFNCLANGADTYASAMKIGNLDPFTIA